MSAVEPPASAERQPRSYLYVPGDQDRLLAKALDRGANALVVDLEDAVHPARKVEARDCVAGWLATRPEGPVPLWVRLNAGSVDADLLALSAPVTGVMLPAAELSALEGLTRSLEHTEARLGLPAGTLGVIARIETAQGRREAAELAAHPRVRHLAIGRADLAGDLGIAVDPDGPEFRALMLPLVVASAAAGIAAPIAPTSTDFRDLAKLRETTAALAALGFRARTAIHPAQVAVINEVFTPGAREVERAERTLAVFQAALDQGSGVAVDDDGTMIDAAVVRRARAVLAQAGR